VSRASAAKRLPEPIPCERRKEIGRIRALIDTTRVLLRTPVAFHQTPPTEDGPLGAAMYGLAIYTLGQLVSNTILFGGFAVASLIGGVALDQAAIGGVFAGYSLCWLVLAIPMTFAQAPVQALFGILGGGGLTHLSLRLMKSAHRPFEETLRAVGYANAPYIFYAIPCFGPFIGWFWMLYLEVVGVREAHGIATDRAAFAVLGWRLLMTIGLVIAYVAIGAVVFLLESRRYQ
jgi:hypothetical protein